MSDVGGKLEAAIGIEPMNKAFAVFFKRFALDCTREQHRVNKRFIDAPCNALHAGGRHKYRDKYRICRMTLFNLNSD